MSRTISVYQGRLRASTRVEGTGTEIITDASPEHKGLGEFASATDVVAAALAACLVTMLGAAAERLGLTAIGARVEVEKDMARPATHIATLRATVHMPAGLTADQRSRIESTVRKCPVHATLADKVARDIVFIYPD